MWVQHEFANAVEKRHWKLYFFLPLPTTHMARLRLAPGGINSTLVFSLIWFPYHTSVQKRKRPEWGREDRHEIMVWETASKQNIILCSKFAQLIQWQGKISPVSAIDYRLFWLLFSFVLFCFSLFKMIYVKLQIEIFLIIVWYTFTSSIKKSVQWIKKSV